MSATPHRACGRRRKPSAARASTGTRNSGFERRAVDAFPAQAAGVAHGEAAIVQRGVHHAGEPQVIEDLRQDRRHAETPPPEDGRPRVEMLAVDRQALFKLPANGLGPQQRQFQFAEFAADDARGALLQCLAQGVQRGGFSGGHLLENLGGKEQVAGLRSPRRWIVLAAGTAFATATVSRARSAPPRVVEATSVRSSRCDSLG